MDFIRIVRNMTLALCLTLGAQTVFAETKNDTQTIEEVAKFAEESSRMREEHIREMRELHLKHINEMYDRKLARNKEMTELWKQLRPGDKAANKALHAQIKAKKDSFEKEDKQFREEFKDNVLRKKHKEFHAVMKARQKEMKSKFKD